MNLYAIVIGIVLGGLALYGAEEWGSSRGEAIQARADQVKFDGINRQLEAQTADANKLRHDLDAAALAKAAADAKITQQQENLHASDLALTEARRRALARLDGGRLRVAVAIPNGACGGGGGGDVSTGADAAGPARTAVVELSGPTSRDLRELVLDADQLADDYRACYRGHYPAWRGPVTQDAAADVPAAQNPDTPATASAQPTPETSP